MGHDHKHAFEGGHTDGSGSGGRLSAHEYPQSGVRQKVSFGNVNGYIEVFHGAR